MGSDITTRGTLTVGECARILGISKNLCYQLMREGRLPSLRLGKRLVVPKVALDRVLARAAFDEG